MATIKAIAAPVGEAPQEQFFTCQRCNVAKPYSAFSKDRARNTGIKNWCKPCAYAYGRKWVLENPERQRHLQKQSYWRNPEARRQRRRAQRSSPEKERAWVKKFKSKNPHLVVAWVAKRKAQKLQATPQWANHDEIKDIYRRSRELTRATGIRHNVDHIIPLQGRDVCGLHVESNLQILTQAANFQKHLSYEREWR